MQGLYPPDAQYQYERAKCQIGTAPTPEKESAASIALRRLEEVMIKSQELVELVASRTSSVTLQEPATPELSNKEIKSCYPPLFGKIIEMASVIYFSLTAIEDNMRRIEL
jgi:hypothetical protein